MKECKWIPKKGIHIEDVYDGRHPGESSRRSRRNQTPPSMEEVNFDRSPPIRETFIQHSEPEINWKRRSMIRVQEEGEDDETMDVEVVYVVGHIGESSGMHYQRRKSRERPLILPTEGPLSEQLEESSSSSEGEQDEEQEEEEPVLADAIKMVREQKYLRRQLKAKDKEISQLGAKMNEMMAQMTAMLQVMQRGVVTGAAPVPPTNHQASSGAPPNPTVNHKCRWILRTPHLLSNWDKVQASVSEAPSLTLGAREQRFSSVASKFLLLSPEGPAMLSPPHSVHICPCNVQCILKQLLLKFLVRELQCLRDLVALRPKS